MNEFEYKRPIVSRNWKIHSFICMYFLQNRKKVHIYYFWELEFLALRFEVPPTHTYTLQRILLGYTNKKFYLNLFSLEISKKEKLKTI